MLFFLPSVGAESARGPWPRAPHSPFFGGIGLWRQKPGLLTEVGLAGRVPLPALTLYTIAPPGLVTAPATARSLDPRRTKPPLLKTTAGSCPPCSQQTAHRAKARSLSLSLQGVRRAAFFFLAAGLRGHVVTLRPSARPTTPCDYGVAGFGVPAD